MRSRQKRILGARRTASRRHIKLQRIPQVPELARQGPASDIRPQPAGRAPVGSGRPRRPRETLQMSVGKNQGRLSRAAGAAQPQRSTPPETSKGHVGGGISKSWLQGRHIFAKMTLARSVFEVNVSFQDQLYPPRSFSDVMFGAARQHPAVPKNSVPQASSETCA